MARFNTGNPLGSNDPRDLSDNSDIIDNYVNSQQSTERDRFGVARRTWAGIEDEANLNISAAEQAKELAEEARDQAVAAAEASGSNVKFAQTYADATALLPLADGTVVEVFEDETKDNSRTRYIVESGALVFAVDLDQVRRDLADPTKGAGIVARSVIAVDGIAHLLVVPTDMALHAHVKGYYTGTKTGGGIYWYDEDRSKSDHNGATVISPTVPWNGLISTQADFLDGVGETDPSGSGCWVLVDGSTVTPYTFGCPARGNDATYQVQKFLDILGSNTEQYKWSLESEADVSSRLELTAPGIERRLVDGLIRLYVTEDVRDIDNPHFLKLTTVRRWKFTGGFYIDAYTSASGFKRIINGIALDNCRLTEIDIVNGRGAEGWLIWNVDGNSNGLNVRQISGNYFGWDGQQKTTRPSARRDYTFLNYTNAQDSFSRRMNVTLDLNDFDDGAISTMVVVIEGRPNVVVTYDRVTQSAALFPGFPNAHVFDGNEARLIYGGGMYSRGGDSGEISIDVLDISNSGIMYWDSSLYGVVIKRPLSQANGCGYVTGRAPSSIGGQGSVLIQPYFENNFIDLIAVSEAARGLVIAPIELRPNRVWSLGPPVRAQQSLDRFQVWGHTGNNPSAGTIFYQSLEALYMPGSVNVRDELPRTIDYQNESRTDRYINLIASSGFDEMRRSVYGGSVVAPNIRTVTIFGKDRRFEIRCDAGFTLNGTASPIVLASGLPDGTTIKAVLRGSDWKVVLYTPGDFPTE